MKDLIITSNNSSLPDCVNCGKPVRIIPVRNIGKLPIYAYTGKTVIRIVPWAFTQVSKCNCTNENQIENKEELK